MYIYQYICIYVYIPVYMYTKNIVVYTTSLTLTINNFFLPDIYVTIEI